MKRKKIIPFLLIFGFLLGISDGYITLWRDGQTQPVKVFPYRAESLPIADQQALKKGIHLSDEASLVQLLEDYLS